MPFPLALPQLEMGSYRAVTAVTEKPSAGTHPKFIEELKLGNTSISCPNDVFNINKVTPRRTQEFQEG